MVVASAVRAPRRPLAARGGARGVRANLLRGARRGFVHERGEGGDPERIEDLPGLFAGLDGLVVIRDAAGREVERQPLGAEKVRHGFVEGEAILADLSTFETGEYTIAVQIDQGAPALDGMEQTVAAYYLLCGSEFLPGVMAGLVGVVAGLPGIVLGLVFLFRTHRERSGGKPPAGPLD